MQEAIPLIEVSIPYIVKKNAVGLVFCACWNDHIALKWQKCGIFVALLVSFLSLALLLPYITMIAKKLLPAFLPLVSDAGGYPPCSGIFAICLIFAAFFSMILFPILYESIKHRNIHDWKFIKLANKGALIVITISFFGLIITACNPVGFTDVPNKFEWVMTVLGEHGVGASMIFIGVGLYQFFVGALWWYLPDASKTDRYIKLGFMGVYIILFLLTVYPLPAMVLEELGPHPFDFARMKKVSYDLPRVYSVSHMICSICEYAVCILSLINIALLYKDLQKVSLRVVLRHKSCTTEAEEPAPSIKLKTIS
ncbi:DNA damage-regulated autophagy modulator protein 1-like isoform X1 [Argiope bruennichi]|nr:DNA damage-regulated autophagy modulator protein 1-like isoform X1 [Argiope bruennichi]